MAAKRSLRTDQTATPLAMAPDEFRDLGHKLVDRIADFIASLPERPVTTGEAPSKIRQLLGGGSLPEDGVDGQEILAEVATLLFDHSLFNGHPKFWGYITSSAAPIGALGDLLAASVNPNVGAWNLAPVASEMERQTVQWISEMIGYASDSGGILVSGGNMANFVGFLTARYAKAGWNIRESGMLAEDGKILRIYASDETHTWIQKAADMTGLGTNSIRWIKSDSELRMDVDDLRMQIRSDLERDERPFIVVGTAGSVGTGAVDPLQEIATLCREHDIWFHVDGAYGAFAAAVPEIAEAFQGMELADSIALDPHKWLYAPLEAGCTLVRDEDILRSTFSYHPEYYKFDEVGGEPTIVYNEYGPQNSRGFRALKVWLGLKQAGRSGYERMISDDIELAKELFRIVEARPDFEAVSHNLSITTFRYIPENFQMDGDAGEAALNELNAAILTRLQEGGEAFVSNAVIHGKYVLRACIVNFRSTIADISALPDIIARIGKEVAT